MTDPLTEIAAILEHDLLSRVGAPSDHERAMIASTAGMAAHLVKLDRAVRHGVADARAILLHRAAIDTLLRGLCFLGTDRIAGTAAEDILRTTMQTAANVEALAPHPPGLAN